MHTGTLKSWVADDASPTLANDWELAQGFGHTALDPGWGTAMADSMVAGAYEQGLLREKNEGRPYSEERAKDQLWHQASNNPSRDERPRDAPLAAASNRLERHDTPFPAKMQAQREHQLPGLSALLSAANKAFASPPALAEGGAGSTRPARIAPEQSGGAAPAAGDARYRNVWPAMVAAGCGPKEPPLTSRPQSSSSPAPQPSSPKPSAVASGSSAPSLQTSFVVLNVVYDLLPVFEGLPAAFDEAIGAAVAAHVGDASRSKAKYKVASRMGPQLAEADRTVSVQVSLLDVKSPSVAKLAAVKLQPPPPRLCEAIAQRLVKLPGMAEACKGVLLVKVAGASSVWT